MGFGNTYTSSSGSPSRADGSVSSVPSWGRHGSGFTRSPSGSGGVRGLFPARGTPDLHGSVHAVRVTGVRSRCCASGRVVHGGRGGA